MYFRQVFLVACLTAIVASIGFTLYQFYFVTPIIFAAEFYEIAESVDAYAQPEPWGPTDGIERSSYTLLANFLMSLAFSLLLACAMIFRGESSVFKGFAWGVAAYLAFFVAPSLGLAPEIPGMEAAELVARQNWWFLSVVMTAIGLAVFAFGALYYKGAGLIFIILPHLIGAPVAESHGFSHPDPNAVMKLTELWHQFILHSSIANALLWLIIGTTTGFLCHKYIDVMTTSLEPNLN
ncbi:MAG: hypothetical protein GQ582_08865 [Methyloprofundus sp.]|nr:hypothetical protein [Methyloprofundus sp.]